MNGGLARAIAVVGCRFTETAYNGERERGSKSKSFLSSAGEGRPGEDTQPHHGEGERGRRTTKRTRTIVGRQGQRGTFAPPGFGGSSAAMVTGGGDENIRNLLYFGGRLSS